MKGNVIQMNTLHLNSVRLNGIGKVQSVSLKGGSTEDPVFPPVEPPVEPTPTYTLSASVTNGKVSATRNGSAVNLPFTANEGDVIIVEVTPNDGYAFEGWNDGNTDNPRTITMASDVVLSAQCVEVVQPPVGNYIQFEDAEVERVLMSKGVSSDGVGITIEDAEKVTSIGNWFRENNTIKSFDEFKYFKGVKSLVGDAFAEATNLETISLPPHCTIIGSAAFWRCSKLATINGLEQVTSVGSQGFFTAKITSLSLPNYQGAIAERAFSYCSNLELADLGAGVTQLSGEVFSSDTNLATLIVRATTPPSLVGSNFYQCPLSVIYVPDASLEAYKTATNWNQYADQIKPLSLFYSLVIIPNNETIYDSQVHLTALYKGVEVEAEYIVDSDIATIGANGLLTFSSAGVVVVTATYNGMTANSTIEYSPICIEHGVALNEDGSVAESANMSTVGFVQTGGATSIKWGVTGGTLGMLCEYAADGTHNDYWGAQSNPRTVTIKSSSTQVKASFSTAHLDNAYIYDNTNGIYLWKGKNVK